MLLKDLLSLPLANPSAPGLFRHVQVHAGKPDPGCGSSL